MTESGRSAQNAARRCGLMASVLLLTAGVAGCAQPPQARHGHSKEYFAEAKYGPASPRVVADGEPVPRGGGQYLVGHPYKIAGHTYYPAENDSYTAVGMASWYGDAFQGRRTANGEIYDKESISAAHPTMPLPSYARVTNLGNGHSIIVRVNDRGPYHGGRVMDVSSRVADALDFKGSGTARVKVEYIGKASLDGSDDGKLLATLRLDGAPATLDGTPSGKPVLVASAILAPVRSLASVLTASAPRPSTPAPQPAPEPAAVAEEAPAPETAAQPVEAPSPPARATLVDAPTPPARPFDLGTIPDASTPLPPVRTSAGAPTTAKLRTVSTNDALYFSDSDSVRMFMQRRGPFDGLAKRGFAPLNQKP